MNLIKAYHWALCQKDDSDEKVLRGSASLILERRDASAKSVLLDVNKLQVWAQVWGSNQESPYWKSETDLWGVEGNFLSNHLCYWRHERWAAWSTRPLVKSWTLRWTVQVSTGKRWRFFFMCSFHCPWQCCWLASIILLFYFLLVSLSMWMWKVKLPSGVEGNQLTITVSYSTTNDSTALEWLRYDGWNIGQIWKFSFSPEQILLYNMSQSRADCREETSIPLLSVPGHPLQVSDSLMMVTTIMLTMAMM